MMKQRWIALILIPLLLMLLTVPVAAASGSASAPTSGTLAICVVIGIVAAGVVCLILYSQMKNVHTKTEAQDYIAGAGLELTGRSDVFLRRTVTRRKIESGNSRS